MKKGSIQKHICISKTLLAFFRKGKKSVTKIFPFLPFPSMDVQRGGENTDCVQSINSYLEFREKS